MTSKRIPPEARTRQLLGIALGLAQSRGLYNVTREMIADAACVAAGLVSLRLGSMDSMREAVMREAVEQKILDIVAEGLARRPPDPHALAAPLALRKKAAALMAGA